MNVSITEANMGRMCVCRRHVPTWVSGLVGRHTDILEARVGEGQAGQLLVSVLGHFLLRAQKKCPGPIGKRSRPRPQSRAAGLYLGTERHLR